MSRLVGLPVHAVKCTPGRQWKYKSSLNFVNQEGTFLHVQPDASMTSNDDLKGNWGWAPQTWDRHVGSILVVRTDTEDVTKHEVEALSRFCQHKMQPLFHDSIEGIISRAEVLSHLTPQKFTEYFEKVRRKRFSKDPSWANATLGQLV